MAEVAPELPVTLAAHYVLKARLGAVWALLPRAARCDDGDPEHVHQLRVATRRAHAAMQAFDAWLPRRRARRIAKLLRKVRRAAGRARDLDVQHARLHQQVAEGRTDVAPVAKKLARRRAAAQAPIAEVYERLKAKHYRRRVEELLERLQRPRSGVSEPVVAEFGVVRVRIAAANFFAVAPRREDDIADLHRARIQGKKLRYTLEIFAGIWDKPLWRAAYVILEQLQQHLGDLVDCHMAIARYARWRRRTKRVKLRRSLDRMIENEELELAACRRQFESFWTPARSDELCDHLARLTADSQVPTVLKAVAGRLP